MFKGNLIDLVSWYAVFYFITAVGFFIWKKTNDHFIKVKGAARARESMHDNGDMGF
jgi:hypothetical protein